MKKERDKLAVSEKRYEDLRESKVKASEPGKEGVKLGVKRRAARQVVKALKRIQCYYTAGRDKLLYDKEGLDDNIWKSQMDLIRLNIDIERLEMEVRAKEEDMEMMEYRMIAKKFANLLVSKYFIEKGRDSDRELSEKEQKALSHNQEQLNALRPRLTAMEIDIDAREKEVAAKWCEERQATRDSEKRLFGIVMTTRPWEF
ncbi:hypothetical protein EJ08DRAFT_333019 [Tothia fuscella]|uniref:Uncharacterized protein n=1 Tax=Tothia fuscella TaxID=1048955 RepID=A0A9P4TWA8_9PEZI|nr:hypothetical protein EJ08DRAFT_333019 [Tothia fuscella]